MRWIRHSLLVIAATVLATITPAVAAAAPYSAGRGTLTLSASTVAPGGQVTANADGYAATGEVRILVGDEPAATVRTDAKGVVNAAFTVPAGVRGAVEVRAMGVDPDRATRVLTAPLTIVDGNDPAAAEAAGGPGGGGGSDRTVEIVLTLTAIVVVGAAMAAMLVRRRRAG